MLNGYMGKILCVDLTDRKIVDESPNEVFYRKYIGGVGLGAKILFDRIPKGANPLGPNNILGFTTGPITGVPGLQASRFLVACKSPLTGAWADSNCGGYFGPALKFSGYDAVFFKGISDSPVYLFINEGKAELREASHLWGKDTTLTERTLKKELGPEVAIACIGPAAEKLSLITGVVHDEGCVAARNGVGAVMGSKLLKAVAVYGTQKVPIDRQKVIRFAKEYTATIRQSPLFTILRDQGTSGLNSFFLESGEMPLKNWGGSVDADVPGKDHKILDGSKIIERQNKAHRCLGCIVACKGYMQAGTEYRYPAGVHKPEYETFGTFGTLCLNWNLESIVMANKLCNDYGIDTISAGSVIAWAIECYEEGIITKEEAGGIELTWGNHEAILEILDKIGKREGFGAVLADGSKKASERIGRGSERFVVHCCRQEPGMHDPRVSLGYLGDHICDSAPGRHTSGIKEGDVSIRTVDNFGLCKFHLIIAPNLDLAEMLKTITGWDTDIDEVQQAGLRSAHLRQAFTSREGITPKDMLFQDCKRPVGDPPIESGPVGGVVLNQDEYQKKVFERMEWDLESGKPLKRSLNRVGLERVAKALWG